MGWSVFTKRGLGARLSCSEEDFATEKCRSIDRLAEKGFCNKSSNKPSLLNRKQFPRASSYIPDTNWPFKWSLRKVIDCQTNPCNALPESYYRRLIFICNKKKRKGMQLRLYQSHGCDYSYFYHVQTFNDHFYMCSRDMPSHKRTIRTRIIIFCALVLLQNVFWCEL